MRTELLSALGVLGLTVSASASTFTLNDADAYCVSGPCVDLSANVEIANQLGVGAVYGLSDPSFIDGDGNPYAARVTVLGTGGPAGASHSSINTFQVNSWIHYQFEFVESFDSNTLTFGANTTVANVRFINIEDIDSNFGSNMDFTDVAGVNLPLIGLGSALEEEGFLSQAVTGVAPPSVGAEFNFVRLDPGANGNWTDEGNVPANANAADKATVTASFGTGQDLSGFEFIWGSTGDGPPNRVRGWDLTIAADPTTGTPPDVAPIPLPPSMLLLLAGVGGLAFMRRGTNA